jgi:hypothetical protein
MKKIICIIIFGAVTFVTAQPSTLKKEYMLDNTKYLNEAQARIKAFDTTMEPERLLEASISLDHVNLSLESGANTRTQLRTACLSLWLNLIQVIDHYLDPSFNPDDVPPQQVEPPQVPGGTLRSGASPSLVKDPKARAEYEKAIADNRKKAVNYRMQIQLNRLKDRISPRAEAFITNSYTSVLLDQIELKTAIEKIIKSPNRKKELLKLLKPTK